MAQTESTEKKLIKISGDTVEVLAELDDSGTAQNIWEALPTQVSANLWGDEIYFELSIECDRDNLKEVVELGDIGYWEPGDAMCLFFGPTPASRGNEIRPASKVQVFGKIVGDSTVLKRICQSETLTLERVEN